MHLLNSATLPVATPVAQSYGSPYASGVQIRFYIDPASGLPHIYDHDVNEQEVEQVLANRGEDRPGSKDSRVAIGQTDAGRYLRVIYVRDPKPDSVFVITAYELSGKPLKAYKRRIAKK